MADNKVMLNFKYGLFEKLPTSQKPGTIYVTADEQAMYVDLPDVKNSEGEVVVDAGRVRLGSVIIKESSRDLVPPYNPSAIYYFAEENALLRWNPTGGEQSTGAWDQINSVKAISDGIDAVAARVTVLEGNVTSLQSEDARLAGLIGDANGGLTKALNDEVARATGEEGRIEGLVTAEASRADTEEKRLAGLIQTNVGSITALDGRLSTAEGEIDTLQSVVGNADSGLVKDLADLANRVTTAEGEIDGHDTAISNINGQISTINGTLTDIGGSITTLQGKDTELSNKITLLEDNKLDKSVYEGKVTTLESLISANEAAAKDAKDAADAAQGTANDNAAAILTLQNTVGNADSGLVKGLAEANNAINALDTNKVNVSDYNTKVNELNEAIGVAKKAGDDAQQTANDNAAAIITLGEKDTELAGLITGLDTRLTTAEGTVADHGTRMTAVEGKASKNESDISGLAGRMGTAEGKITTNEGAITALGTRMNTAEGDIDNLETEVGNLSAKIGTIPEDSVATNVIDYINGQFEAANAMHFIGGIDDATDLPSTGVQAGDTYVIVADDVTLVGESYYAGDLIIANADQGSAETYEGGWTHVRTGYQADHNAKLTGTDNKIKLTTLADGVNLGEIAVETDGSALTASIADNKLSLGLEWGSFED